ncbi:MAG: hypothetical protein WCE43_08565 [Burkholderiales bacterium]
MLSRWIQTLLLAIVLLYAQQIATLHAMSHMYQGQKTQQEQDLPSVKACSQCIALAEIQSAVPAGHPPFAALLTHFAAYFIASTSPLVQIALGFSARAPPYSL